MHLLKSGVAVLALTAFAVVPAQACSWNKTAKAEDKMTVAQTDSIPQIDADVAIATNDLSDDALTEQIVLPEDTPAE
ncbi:hypothetical protein [Roseibium sediminicola]|uniref:Uncharacterized protein n=1 Tax=Roseibium sediminicola TaxID=2933272 RepID=A0ABT0GX74_9HYPH|nr:hypothetical protein [Roseibium sp. CAU 1639]MCK7613405.1 hypothetical protein [Roseibium sp. CAU 1639]